MKKNQKGSATKIVFLIISVLLLALLVYPMIFSKDSQETVTSASGFLGNFDLFQNQKENKIIFQSSKDGHSGIYAYDLHDNSLKKISSNGESVNIPRVSTDGSTAVYVKATQVDKSIDAKFVLVNLANGERKEVEFPKQFATPPSQVVLSKDKKGIFFIGSAFYGNYDGIARKGAHENDLYYLDLESGNLEKLTDLSSYAMDDLHLSSNGEGVNFSYIKDKINRVMYVSFDIKNKKTGSLLMQGDTVFKDGTITGIQKYGDKFVLTGSLGEYVDGHYVYDLYFFDPKTSDLKRLTTLNANIGQFIIVNNVITFSVNTSWPKGREYKIMSINLDGTGLKEITLPVVPETGL